MLRLALDELKTTVFVLIFKAFLYGACSYVELRQRWSCKFYKTSEEFGLSRSNWSQVNPKHPIRSRYKVCQKPIISACCSG